MPDLGTTGGTFAVLGGSTVTNTGPSVIDGNVGVSTAGGSITGFPPGVVTAPGVLHPGDPVAGTAATEIASAYGTLAGQACNFNLTGQDLGGKTLVPGVYCLTSSAQLTGNLTLDAQGVAGAVFVFQIGTTLTTASASSVLAINGASSCNVFFQVGSSATLGTTTAFTGNILAAASITLNTGASIDGRALAGTGAVTLDSNVVGPSLCAPAATAVTVRSFTATRSAGKVMCNWSTVSGTEALGYNVYGLVRGQRVKLNKRLIAAKSAAAASYAFHYRAPAGQKAPTRVWLQVVNLDGSRHFYGAASVRRISS